MSPLARLFSQHRITVSRVFGIAFVVALLATGSVWQGTLVGRAMFLVGIVLAAIGMVGRIWCLTYSSGYKSSELVTQGPYSVCRNPLYFFSFIGLIGIGLATETITLTLFLIAFFVLVYPAVIAGEEEFLRGKFGQVYVDYCNRTPRFFPRRDLFVEPEDEIVARNRDEWTRIIENAKPIVEHVMVSLGEGKDLNDHNVVNEIAGQVLLLIQDLPSPADREFFTQRLARFLRVDERAFIGTQAQASRLKQPARRIPQKKVVAREKPVVSVSSNKLVEEYIIGVLFRRPELLYRLDRWLQQFGLVSLSVQDFEYTDHQMMFR